MLTISSLGSCRVATPLRLMRESFGYEVNMNRNYGFCHSSSEAVQMMQFMKGEYVPNKKIWNLISRGKDYDILNEMPFVNSDLFIVEISSAKRLTIGNDCIQLNYLVNAFSDFFSSAERSKVYWRFASRNDGQELEQYLQDVWYSSEKQILESETLSKVRRTIMSEEEIKSDVKKLMAGLSNVLFVTHVNALKPDGNTISSRSSLIEMVKKVVRNEGGTVYDPTEKMLELGQANAIEDHSDSLAHYTEEFAELIFLDWYNLIIESTIFRLSKLGEVAFENIMVPHVEALISINRISHLPARFDSLEKEGVSFSKLYECSAKINSILGEYEKTHQTLKESLAIYPGNLELTSQLFTLLLEQNRYDEATDLIPKLIVLGSQISTDDLYELGAFYTDSNKLNKAIEMYALILQNDSHCQVAAGKIAEIFTSHTDFSMSKKFTDEVLSALLKLLPPTLLYRMSVIDLDLSCELDLKELIEKSTEQEVIDFCKYLIADDKKTFASDLLFFTQKKHAGSLISLVKLNSMLAEIAEKWLIEYEEAGDILSKYESMRSLQRAFPLLREVRINTRDLDKTVLTEIRRLFSLRDLESLESLQIIIPEEANPRFELDLMLARLYYDNNSYELAVACAKRAVKLRPDSIMSNLTLMRSAMKIEHYNLADKAAHKIISLDDGESVKVQSEALLNISRLPKKCWLAARYTNDLLEKVLLLRIAERDDDFFDKCQVFLSRISKALITEVISMEKNKSSELIEFSLKVHELFPKKERLLLILARNLDKKRNYNMALPFWDKLINIAPENDNYAFHQERCMAKAKL